MSGAGETYIPGVEQPLPPGERVLWHGRPTVRAVALHVFHIRTLAAYFVAILVLRVVSTPSTGGVGLSILAYSAYALVALLVFVLISAWVARSTVYAITERRVVLKIGMAMPMTISVPLSCIASADVREWSDGTGEIALALSGTDRFAYAVLWPHARPWQIRQPQPTLRGLTGPREVGALLCSAVAAAGGTPIASRGVEQRTVAGTLAPPTAVAGD